MAHPKRRASKQRKHTRTAHIKLTAPQLAPCERCSNLKPAHRVCPQCGTYKGEEVITPKYDA